MYIGNSPIYSENPKCPGGPHLKATYDDYPDEAATDDVKSTTQITSWPAFGFEVKCNMAGRYTFYVATKVPTKEVAISSIAVFGTRFIRA